MVSVNPILARVNSAVKAAPKKALPSAISPVPLAAKTKKPTVYAGNCGVAVCGGK